MLVCIPHLDLDLNQLDLINKEGPTPKKVIVSLMNGIITGLLRDLLLVFLYFFKIFD